VRLWTRVLFQVASGLTVTPWRSTMWTQTDETRSVAAGMYTDRGRASPTEGNRIDVSGDAYVDHEKEVLAWLTRD
jgi:hypothetical protein